MVLLKIPMESKIQSCVSASCNVILVSPRVVLRTKQENAHEEPSYRVVPEQMLSSFFSL